MKKLLPLVLTLSVSLCLASPSHAAQAEIEQVITALEIMQGDHTGNLNLQNPVNRAEFITMSVNLLLGKNQVSTPTTSPYPDVSRDHWSAPYVVAGVQYELIAGYADGTFRPGNQITLGEASVIIPKLLGYTTADFSGVSMEGRVLWMATNDMLDNVTVSGAYDALTRYDTMHLFYNALTASTKQGTPLITTMGYPVTASGEIDRVALLTSTMEGPLQATLNWQSSIPITNYLAISINGTPSNASDIRPNDLIYWSTPARTLWVYRSQITGILGAVSPNNTVTISNNTYAIETEQATYALSSLGSFRQGDLVTALLGRDGGIAVISTPMAGVDSVCGLVLARTTTSYDDGAGGTYMGPAIAVLATDENVYTYPVSDDKIEADDIVQVTVNSSGSLIISRVSSTSLSGQFSNDGSKLGEYPISSDIEILDLYESSGIRLYPSRLAGLTLSRSDVLYYRLDSNGAIDRLILDDFSGEHHTYGMLLEKEEFSFGSSLTVIYELSLSSGTSYLNLSKSFPAKEGPVVIMGSMQDPDDILSLEKKTVDRFEANAVVLGGKSYSYAQSVVVLERVGDEYFSSTLARISSGAFDTVSACYRSSSDPAIRLIIAEN